MPKPLILLETLGVVLVGLLIIGIMLPMYGLISCAEFLGRHAIWWVPVATVAVIVLVSLT